MSSLPSLCHQRKVNYFQCILYTVLLLNLLHHVANRCAEVSLILYHASYLNNTLNSVCSQVRNLNEKMEIIQDCLLILLCFFFFLLVCHCLGATQGTAKYLFFSLCSVSPPRVSQEIIWGAFRLNWVVCMQNKHFISCTVSHVLSLFFIIKIFITFNIFCFRYTWHTLKIPVNYIAFWVAL